MLKKSEQVLDAIKSGADSSVEVARATGMSVKIASARVFELIKDGRVRKTGRIRRTFCKHCKRPWRRAYCVEAIPEERP